jgi:hypothetical protein
MNRIAPAGYGKKDHNDSYDLNIMQNTIRERTDEDHDTLDLRNQQEADDEHENTL